MIDWSSASIGKPACQATGDRTGLSAIGPALPPWLDEGLCDDLANLPIDGDGRLLASGWGGRRSQETPGCPREVGEIIEPGLYGDVLGQSPLGVLLNGKDGSYP